METLELQVQMSSIVYIPLYLCRAGGTSLWVIYLQEILYSCNTFPATLPGAHFNSKQREKTGLRVDHHTHLTFLPGAIPARQPSATDTISALLAPISRPELPAQAAYIEVISTQDYFLYNK